MSKLITDRAVPKKLLTTRVRNFRGSLLVANGENALELSDSATVIFRVINGNRTVAEIAQLLVVEYDISFDLAMADTRELLDTLVDHNIVEIRQ